MRVEVEDARFDTRGWLRIKKGEDWFDQYCMYSEARCGLHCPMCTPESTVYYTNRYEDRIKGRGISLCQDRILILSGKDQ